ncbi:MAG: alcohol dehydrogenase [Pseudonocardiales bacterium]|nr:alcohol dehydrogenase [Pseudonocardiales bacterium]
MAARSFVVPTVDSVTYGAGAFESIGDLVQRQGAARAFVVLSGSLAGSAVEATLRERLGARLVGVYDRTRQHVPRGSVLEAAEQARAAGADCLVSVGGGTPIDCAKAVALCLATGITIRERFDDYRIRFTYPSTHEVPEIDGELLPHIAVPTTLSGGEHTALVGVTDERTHVKDAFTAPGLMPRAIVLDPVVTRGTPDWLWAASGMRAVDHAVEGILSTRHMPFADGLGSEALRLLTANLAHSAKNPDDLEARTNCLIATWLSIFALTNVGIGLSHGIGHQLAAEFDLLHGLTSAIMLPLVMEFNAAHTAPGLRRIAEAMGTDTTGLDDCQVADAAVRTMREFIASLGVPHTLRAVGANRDALPAVAQRALGDPAVAASPRPVSTQDLLELLEAAW